MARYKNARAPRSDDKRRGGMGDNQDITVQKNDGSAAPLADLFNDRRVNIGHGKKVF